MNNEVKYNVNTVLKTNLDSEKDIIKLFNEKLLKMILSLEKNNKNF